MRALWSWAFLNTLQVAVIGCVLATLLGILVGIGTLSSNWLISKLTAGYIHLLRNVPVLLQIVLWYTMLISDRFLPHPARRTRARRLRDPARRLSAGCPRPTSAGRRPDRRLAIAACPPPVRAGAAGASAQADRARAGMRRCRMGGAAIVLSHRCRPGCWPARRRRCSWPALRGFNITGGARITPEFAAVLFGLTIYTSAFVGEIVRSGILSVPRGRSRRPAPSA